MWFKLQGNGAIFLHKQNNTWMLGSMTLVSRVDNIRSTLEINFIFLSLHALYCLYIMHSLRANKIFSIIKKIGYRFLQRLFLRKLYSLHKYQEKIFKFKLITKFKTVSAIRSKDNKNLKAKASTLNIENKIYIVKNVGFFPFLCNGKYPYLPPTSSEKFFYC